MNHPLQTHVIVNRHVLLLTDHSKTGNHVLTRQRAELEPGATGGKGRNDFGNVVADEAETCHLGVLLHHATKCALSVHR